MKELTNEACLLILVACGLFLPAARPLMAEERLIQKTYPVADLVVPAKGGKTIERQFLKLIMLQTPMSWAQNGGRGTVDYCPLVGGRKT